ncbi:hypothetical protein K7X08_003011 [Anisodus acutangulus]|uniref:Uncharacterized protein n=1 Tax=Anisodus acutangulus TaxID=402998 RepID=A0A9Q1RIB5_9SOLA|nr:hypothetical protein K7X08_003011 [Anisodus acutangulus]
MLGLPKFGSLNLSDFGVYGFGSKSGYRSLFQFQTSWLIVRRCFPNGLSQHTQHGNTPVRFPQEDTIHHSFIFGDLDKQV